MYDKQDFNTTLTYLLINVCENNSVSFCGIGQACAWWWSSIT